MLFAYICSVCVLCYEPNILNIASNMLAEAAIAALTVLVAVYKILDG